MNFTSSLTPDRHRNHNIDVIRGFAVILILILHAGALTPGIEEASRLYYLISRTAVGMQLFFVLSGYMISESWDRAQCYPRSLLTFAIHRAAKILPLYLLVLHLNIAVFSLESLQVDFVPLRNSITSANLTFLNYIAHLLMLQGFIPSWQHSLIDGSWSIVAEFYFYAMAPFLLSRFLTEPAAVLRYICLVLPISILFSWSASDLPGSWGYYGFPAQFPCFLFGVLVYRIRQKWPNLVIGPSAYPLLAICITLAVGMYHGSTSPLGLHIVYAILFAVILFVALASINNPSGRRGFEVFATAGKMSYAMFFSHLFLLKLANPYIQSIFTPGEWIKVFGINALIAIFGSWAMSHWLFHPIDSACVAWARQYTARWRNSKFQ